MKKFYEEPEIQIRNYVLPTRDVVMTSDPNVENPDRVRTLATVTITISLNNQ